jgi:hypothetical protein
MYLPAMSRPTSRAAVLSAIDTGFARLREAVEQVPAVDRLRAGACDF